MQIFYYNKKTIILLGIFNYNDLTIFIGEKAVVTNEKYTLECQLAFRSIGYRSIQADPDISFDNESSTVPQNLGIFIIFCI